MVSDMWAQVDRIISGIYLNKQHGMIKYRQRYNSDKSRNFAEHVRFDFVIDNEFILKAMEVG